MKRHLPVAAALLAAAALLLSSCATSKGGTLALVLGAEANPKEKPPEEEKGLTVETNPSDAQVYLDGRFVGNSPVTVDPVAPGWHRIVVRKDGYYDDVSTIQYSGPSMRYEVTLEQIVGFVQVTASPPGSIAILGGDTLGGGSNRVPIGTYELVVKAFGYSEERRQVTVLENQLTSVDVELVPAPFAVTAFSLRKTAVNPENPGLLGTIAWSVSVTGPGTGTIRFLDSTGAVVHSVNLGEFATWDAEWSWNLRDATGSALVDGSYTVVLDAAGPDGSTVPGQSRTLRVDRSLKIAARSLWSGSAGLLYAPTAETLPAGDFQVGILAAGIATPDFSTLRAPVVIGARLGVGDAMEADAMVGAIAGSSSTPVLASFAFRWNLVSPRSDYGTALAVQAKISGQARPYYDGMTVLPTDTFANFTGLSLEVPFQVSLDTLGILLSAGATGSFWYPYRLGAGGVPVAGPVGWLYLRAGLMLDTGELVAGVSASTRTEPLPGGISFLSSPIPFEVGAEVHWMIPSTSFVLSAIAAGEYQDSSDYYFMGGIGLGFLY